MKLIVDIGNTRIKWAVLDDERAGPSASAVHRGSGADAIRAIVASWPAGIREVLASNVAGPGIREQIETALEQRFGLRPRFALTRAHQLGVSCGYENVSRLGVDRWVGIVEAWNRAQAQARGSAVAVLDAGTTVTFDAVDAGGQHLGGLIFVGAELSARVLELNTSDIGSTPASTSIGRGLELLGRSTAAAVSNAARLGPAAAADRAVRVVEQALGQRLRVYVTGGDGEILAGWLESTTEIRADLVLEGLARIANAGGQD